MQDYVPQHIPRKNLGLQIKSVFMIIIFFILLLGVLIALASAKKTEKCFDKELYYFVYAQKERNTIKQENIDLIKSLGGAGDVYFKSEKFYLIANVYLIEDDADEIANGLTENFEDSGVLTLTAPDIPDDVKKAIKEEPDALRFFKFLQKTIEKTEILNIDYMSGNVTDGKLLNELLEVKLEFEHFSKQISSINEKLFDDICSYINQIANEFTDFFDKFYYSTKKGSLMCSLFVNLVLIKVNLFQNL